MSEVDARLADWLRDVDLQPAADRQSAISTAAGTLATTPTLRALLGLVVVAHGEQDAESGDRIEETIRSADSTWSVRADDAAARRTAAIAVAIAMEGEPDATVAAALGVRSATFLGMTPVVPDLVPLADVALTRASEILRGRTDLGAASTDIKGAFKTVPAMGDGEAALTDHVSAVAKAAQTAALRASKVTGESLPAVTRRFKALEEEVDLLWWLLGEYSERADRAFKAIGAAAAPCVVALDFADLLSCPCPPRATRALLSRALGARAAQTVDLDGAVRGTAKALGSDWVSARFKNHRLLPLLSAAHEYHEFAGKQAWKESVERWGIDPAHESTGLEIAQQLVGECVLAELLQ
jgi:hypothetical protein